MPDLTEHDTTAKRADRFKALADGVFSIAMTLLIIDVVADAKRMAPGVTLASHLLHHWGVGASYLVGFLTIFVCWVNQHAVLDAVERVDRALIWTGGLQLALVAAVPLPTALLADHLVGADSQTAFFMYGVTFLLIASSFWALSASAVRRGFIRLESDRMAVVHLNRVYLIAIGWNVLCLLALQVSFFMALPMWTVMFMVFAFPGEFARYVHRKVGAARP